MLNRTSAPAAAGTTPEGSRNEQEAARWVRHMFGRVAHRYDLANHVLSLNLDRRWRARTAARLEAYLARPEARVLDLCCGTGDLLLELRARRSLPVMGSDFCHPMLTAAGEKASRAGVAAPLFEADALDLPLRDGALDVVTVAFGFRNFANYRRGLAELRRVLRPGGVAAILEFSQPRNRAFAALYGFYSRWVLPRIGGLLSGAPDAYTYLPESVRKFPSAEALAHEMENAGFRRVRYEYLTLGIVALHIGEV